MAACVMRYRLETKGHTTSTQKPGTYIYIATNFRDTKMGEFWMEIFWFRENFGNFTKCKCTPSNGVKLNAGIKEEGHHTGQTTHVFITK